MVLSLGVGKMSTDNENDNFEDLVLSEEATELKWTKWSGNVN